MKKGIFILAALMSFGATAYAANGDLVVTHNLSVGNAVTFPDGTAQTTAAFPVLVAGTATPGTNTFDIPINVASITGRMNITYTITPSADGEPVMIGFNGNLTATGAYTLYAIPGANGANPAISGKVQAGYARTAAGSAAQYNSFNFMPSGNIIFYTGNHISLADFSYWGPIFEGYLTYPGPQTISTINIKCYYATTNILSITWKVIAIP